MKKSLYKYFSLLAAGTILTGAIYTGQTEAAAPKKETFNTTCQLLRDNAAQTLIIPRCKLHISFTAVNQNDRILYTADNIIAAHAQGSKAFWEGSIQKTTIIAGQETTVTIPYYIMRDDSSFSGIIRNGDSWKVMPLNGLTKALAEDCGLQELFADNKTAQCLNETPKGRTTVLAVNQLPMAELLFSVISPIGLVTVPEFTPEFRQSIQPREIFVRQDTTKGIISDINADVTDFIQIYLKKNPQTLTADAEQDALRKILEKGTMNFHVSVSNTDKKVEFHELPQDIPAELAVSIPTELLTDAQLKNRQAESAASSDASAKEDNDEE